MDYIISVVMGLLIGCVIGVNIAYDHAAIKATKGEYVCKYNEFADDWDCKHKEDKQ